MGTLWHVFQRSQMHTKLSMEAEATRLLLQLKERLVIMSEACQLFKNEASFHNCNCLFLPAYAKYFPLGEKAAGHSGL